MKFTPPFFFILLVFPGRHIAFSDGISSTILLFPDPCCEKPLTGHDVPEWILQNARPGSATEIGTTVFFAGGR